MTDSTRIIKCEECEWAKQTEYIFFSCLICENPRGLDRIVAINDFCSYGEKKHTTKRDK